MSARRTCLQQYQRSCLPLLYIRLHEAVASTRYKLTCTFEGLTDLCVRFLINLPTEELATSERLCFQIEEAQWFYEDFIRPSDPELPSLNLRNFTMLMFTECPLTSHWTKEEQEAAFEAFLAYKTSVPVRGAILLNQNMEEVVLVKGWKKGASWSFPRGKIDMEEADLDCALREVHEETGYNIKESDLAYDKENVKSIEVRIRGQELKMFVFRGVPKDTHFEPRTRKEISKIDWYKLSDLPTGKTRKQQQQGHGSALVNTASANKFYMVAPFLGPLKKWITQQRKRDKAMQANQAKDVAHDTLTVAEDAALEQEAIEEEIKDERAEEDHLARLLHTLRQSSQPKVSDLPEVASPSSSSTVVPRGEPAISSDSGSLMALLKPKTASATQEPQVPLGEPASSVASNDLKAFLKIGGMQTNGQKPQTPADQLIEQPTQPPPPPAHDVQHRPASTFVGSPSFPHLSHHPLPAKPPPTAIQQHKDRLPPHTNMQAQVPQMRPIPPPAQRAQLAPRNAAVHPGNSHNLRTAPLPRQIDERTSRGSFPSTNAERPTAPLASELPPPKLNPQSTRLLDLFKGNSSAKATVSDDPEKKDKEPSPISSNAQASTLLSMLKGGKPEGSLVSKDAIQETPAPPVHSPRRMTQKSPAFVPP